ncbi:MAG: FAD-dependent oxidoreductase, partial [Candidatus Methanosuratincola sp.]
MARNQIFADIVVIGGGVSGLVASAAASQQGAKIVVLEKKERVGGILAIPGAAAGFFAVESRLQRQKFLSLTRDEAFKIIMNYSHWKANPYLVRALVEKSSETVDWVESLGLQFTELSPTAMFDGSRHTQHYIRGGGEALLQALLKEIGKTEGRILLGVRGRRLIKENERIV